MITWTSGLYAYENGKWTSLLGEKKSHIQLEENSLFETPYLLEERRGGKWANTIIVIPFCTYPVYASLFIFASMCLFEPSMEKDTHTIYL